MMFNQGPYYPDGKCCVVWEFEGKQKPSGKALLSPSPGILPRSKARLASTLAVVWVG